MKLHELPVASLDSYYVVRHIASSQNLCLLNIFITFNVLISSTKTLLDFLVQFANDF